MIFIKKIYIFCDLILNLNIVTQGQRIGHTIGSSDY